MKMSTKIACVALVLVFCVASALAQNRNPCPGDKEYQFNIIGMKNAKNVDMDNNDGHRIFVALKGTSKVYMTGDTDDNPANGLQCGRDFDVLDANGMDADGAKLLVPCDPLTAEHLDPDVCFDVYATPLGTPGGHTDVDVVCEFDATCLLCDIDGEEATDTCQTGNIDFTLAGHSGRPRTQDITPYFRASGCIDIAGVAGVCDTGDIDFNNEWIFNIEQLLYYYWDYTNDGNRIVQIRFCNVEGIEGACGENVIKS